MKYLYHEIGQTQGITIGFPKTLFTFLYFRFRLYLHGSTVGSLLSVLLEYFMAIFFSQKVGFKLSNWSYCIWSFVKRDGISIL